jgi:hypothetical protein
MATQFPMLGGFNEQQRKDFYSSPGFNPSSLNSALQSTGLSAGAALADYNNLMGTNMSPTQGASWLTGMSTPQMAQWTNANAGNPSAIASNANYFGMGSGDIADLYNQHYGTNVTPGQAQGMMSGGGNTFTIPTNLFPYSQSSSSGGGSNSSYSGMDWSKSPVSFEQLQAQAAALPQMAKDLGTQSYNRYSKMMRDALGDKQNFAGVFNDMGARNMGGSSVASDAYGNAMMGITQDIGDRAYESDVKASLAQMTVPQMLAAIAGLGQVSQGQGSTSSSSQSTTADPLAPYKTIADMIMSGY